MTRLLVVCFDWKFKIKIFTVYDQTFRRAVVVRLIPVRPTISHYPRLVAGQITSSRYFCCFFRRQKNYSFEPASTNARRRAGISSESGGKRRLRPVIIALHRGKKWSAGRADGFETGRSYPRPVRIVWYHCELRVYGRRQNINYRRFPISDVREIVFFPPTVFTKIYGKAHVPRASTRRRK